MAKILVGIAGSIAAYRSPDFVKELVTGGHEVRVVLTSGGREFVSERALETFSGSPVLARDSFHASHLGTDHIAVARWADLFVIYGATADFLARYAGGLADDFLCLQLVATRSPVVAAPAMNPAMWEHASVQENVRTLTRRGVRFVGPVHGKVACGESGLGHIAELREIVAAAERALAPSPLPVPALEGRNILISSGPMRSGLDSVRFIQNRSSGKMGLELARAARALGARVSVLLGPVDASIAREYAGLELQECARYTGAAEYETGLARLLPLTDIFFSAAAVLDFEAIPVAGKIDRSALPGGELKIEYRSVPDFVARAAQARDRAGMKVIAFAAEAGSDAEILERAAGKLARKGVDAIVANPVRPGLGPEAEANELWVLRADAEPIHLGPALKAELAEPLLRALFDPKVQSI
jgi:phosphopantothenoylcysteine decarboxylase/phosphopantothenate--cysteine ligase